MTTYHTINQRPHNSLTCLVIRGKWLNPLGEIIIWHNDCHSPLVEAPWCPHQHGRKVLPLESASVVAWLSSQYLDSWHKSNSFDSAHEHLYTCCPTSTSGLTWSTLPWVKCPANLPPCASFMSSLLIHTGTHNRNWFFLNPIYHLVQNYILTFLKG